MKYYIYYIIDTRVLRDWWEYPIPKNETTRHQVVVATIKRTLSRKREQESEPARW